MRAGGLSGRIWHRIGHRGAFLLFLAVLDALVAYSLTRPETRAQTGRVDLFLPLGGWTVAWAAVAAVVAVGAFVERDRLAFAVAAGFQALWAALYADLWLVQHVPDAWLSVVIWAVFAVTVLLVSSWPEPRPPG